MFPSLSHVPLGSIQELPAESCSETKVSEGNEMVNGDYWIYSYWNGRAILARCEGTACKFIAGAHHQEPATPIISQCNDIFTAQSIFRYCGVFNT